MGVASILADGVGLMIGSLLGAALLTFSAWWLADRAHRCWVAPVLMAVVVTGLMLSPLEASLFVRMLAVFGLVGAGLLWFVGADGAALPIGAERDGGHAFPRGQDK